MSRLVFLTAVVAALLAAPAAAQSFRQLGAGEYVATPGKAYLLFRLPPKGLPPVFLRVPRPAELAVWTMAVGLDPKREPKGFANLHGISGKAIGEDTSGKTMLVEVDPATYVLAGVGNQRVLTTCFCMGTVQFEARAGEVTDLGTLLLTFAARPSTEPELKGVTGLGSQAQMDYALFAGAVRPSGPGTAVPTLPGARIAPASYRATAPFVIRGALLSNWLAPLPGVLDYRRGDVVDVPSGKVLPPR